jgi:hypothetical protein
MRYSAVGVHGLRFCMLQIELAFYPWHAMPHCCGTSNGNEGLQQRPIASFHLLPEADPMH